MPPNPPKHFQVRKFDGILFFLTRDIIPLILATGMSVAIKMTNRWIQSENEIRELEKSRTEAELKNLRNQLNPHFLFNTLNNIYYTMDYKYSFKNIHDHNNYQLYKQSLII